MKKGCWTTVKWVLLGAGALLLLLLGGIALSNRGIPTRSTPVDELGSTELALLDEATRLRTRLGGEVWLGWDTRPIPLVVYNEGYVFLAGLGEPAEGWVRVPGSEVQGGAWEKVPGADYYRQPLPAPGAGPQAFTVRVGERYAASMTSYRWTRNRLVDEIRGSLPGFVSPFVPFRLLLAQFDGDWYVGSLLHESFHAFQADRAYARLAAAEKAVAAEDSYPWEDPELRADWREERELLAEALTAGQAKEVARIAREWLQVRASRREGLSPELIVYERQREWLEGLAKYVEMKVLLVAGSAEDYVATEELADTPDFEGYGEARTRWDREAAQLGRDLQFDPTLFYSTGWAQAVMLDHLTPAWKARAFDSGVFLDELLSTAGGS